ncbi:MAG: pilus assembly protein PilM [Deltaproteobacteria bacterium]|nr:pilus assembly protein PilM [Candidatus Anaeroferrophillus wilburensis]MBN2889431.1 pilus assembly protein PilM [Deltaproteobacteria bacterium]
MFSLGSKKDQLLALDFGPTSLKMVLMRRLKKRSLVEDILFYPYGEEAPALKDPQSEGFFSQIITKALSAYVNKGIPVAMSLPAELVSRQELTLPLMAGKDLPQAIYWALKEKMAQSPDIFQRDHLLLGARKQGHQELQQVRVYLAKQDDIIRLETFFERLGLSIQCLEPEEMSLAAALHHCPPAVLEANPVLVNLGGDGTTIAIISDSLPLLTRWLAISTRSWVASLVLHKGFEPKLASQLIREHGVSFYRHRFDKLAEGELQEAVFNSLESDMQQLALEIHRTTDYFQSTMHKGTVGQVVLTGGGSQLPDLPHYLGETLGVACATYDPLAKLDFSAFKGDEEQLNICRQQASRFTVAVGLALQG